MTSERERRERQRSVPEPWSPDAFRLGRELASHRPRHTRTVRRRAELSSDGEWVLIEEHINTIEVEGEMS